MHLTLPLPEVVAQAGHGGNMFAWIATGVMLLFMLVVFLAFTRVFRIWLQALLARAGIPLVQIIAMMLRKTDAAQIVRLKIMAVQSGVDIPTHELERAYLRGVNVERAVLAMIRAKQIGEQVTWEQLISADVEERLEETAE
jgi:uncharacterized protein YqfA (UPF0365 family)